jgi:hypothetical protein
MDKTAAPGASAVLVEAKAETTAKAIRSLFLEAGKRSGAQRILALFRSWFS